MLESSLKMFDKVLDQRILWAKTKTEPVPSRSVLWRSEPIGRGIEQSAHKRKPGSFHILFYPGNLLVTLTLERISQAHE